MEEFYYFTTIDVLIRTEYAADANSLRYVTHRSITAEERQTIERYILTKVGPKTNYYKHSPSVLIYRGIDTKLEKELKFYRLQESIKDLLNQKSFIDEKVEECINDSLSAYYFERVGDELLRLRKILSTNTSNSHVEKCINRISILLEAYNQRSGENFSMDAILPEEYLGSCHY